MHWDWKCNPLNQFLRGGPPSRSADKTVRPPEAAVRFVSPLYGRRLDHGYYCGSGANLSSDQNDFIPQAHPQARTEHHTEQPKVEESNVSPTDTEKNGALPGGEPPSSNRLKRKSRQTPLRRTRWKINSPARRRLPLPLKRGMCPKQAHPVAESSGTANTRFIEAPHQLEMLAVQKAWIAVTIDGASPEYELLRAGDRRKWEAFKRIDLVIGNRGGVQLKWDGRPVELGSRRSRAIKLSLSGSGIVLK